MSEDKIWPRRSRSRAVALRELISQYGSEVSPAEIETLQLRRFNQVWSFCLSERQFYREWQQRHGLPDQIESIGELDSFPVLTKAEISNSADFVFAESNRKWFYATGGSTSEPTKFPMSRVETPDRFAGNYVGRDWWGIKPRDSRVLLWGHSHLLGAGLKAHYRRLDQLLRDRFTRTTRLDGYKTDLESYRAYIARILKESPKQIVGYTSALMRVANAASEQDREGLRALDLKGVIGTADTMSEADEQLLAEVFCCPIINEYGAAETGVVAISHPDGDLRVLWGEQLVRVQPEHGVLVSSLIGRQFPLINYSLGDHATAMKSTRSGGCISLSAISGRLNDFVVLDSLQGGQARQVWAVHLTHMIKSTGRVVATQYEQREEGKITVRVALTDRSESGMFLNEVNRVLLSELAWADLSKIRWDFDTPHQKTRSGKHRVLVDKSDRAA